MKIVIEKFDRSGLLIVGDAIRKTKVVSKWAIDEKLEKILKLSVSNREPRTHCILCKVYA